jgi:O-antigen ligase
MGPSSVERLQPPRATALRLTGASLRRLGNRAPWLIVALCCVAVGALAGREPMAATALLGTGWLMSLAVLRRPVLLLLGLAAFLVLPYRYFPDAGAYVQMEKGLLYAAGLALLLQRGVIAWRLLPVAGYAALACMSALGGTPIPGLTNSQTAESFITLTCGWLLFAARWDFVRDAAILRAVAVMPSVCVGVGVMLQGAGLWRVFGGDEPPRLQGALIPPFLAFVGLAGAAAALVLWRRSSWRPGSALLVGNSVIVAGTLTRGALVALSFLLAATVVRMLRTGARTNDLRLTARAVGVVAGLLVAVTLAAPAISQRNDALTYVQGRGLVRSDGTNGRLDAWRVTYGQAKVNLVFGRGLGSAPLLGASQEFFLAQHNEYLRLLLEGGFVGGLLVLLSILYVVTRAVRRAPSSVRADLGLFSVGMLSFSATDNTLTTTQSSAFILLVLGIGTAAAAPSSGHVSRVIP